MTAVIAMHPSRFGAIRSLVPFQDFRLKLRKVDSLVETGVQQVLHRVIFQPIDQGDLLDAGRLAQVARVYGRSAQFDGDVFDCVAHWLASEDQEVDEDSVGGNAGDNNNTVNTDDNTAQGGKASRVIVGFSALSLEDEAFVPRLIKITEHYVIDPARICLELDQAVFHPHEEDVKVGLESLRQAGFQIGLQRSGGMALELCACALVDHLTVGRRHVGSMLEDPRRYQAIVAMGQFAKTMGVNLIADGVNSYERLGALIQCGVTHASGPLFGEDRLVSISG